MLKRRFFHRPAPCFSVKAPMKVGMATLTLNKSKASSPIKDKPTNDLINKYAVMRHARNTSSFRFSNIHDSFDSAKTEATRLSGLNSSERYLVLHVVEGVEA
jgi:hypothetical protein